MPRRRDRPLRRDARVDAELQQAQVEPRAGDAAKVAVVAPSDRRRSFALAMGADAFVVTGGSAASAAAGAADASAEDRTDPAADSDARIRAALDGPPDVVFECAGFPGAVMQAMNAIRAKGTIVCMGYGLHPETILTAVPLFKELCARFSMTYDRNDYQEVIANLAAGHLEPRCMITKTIALEGLAEDPPQHDRIEPHPTRDAGS